MPKLLLSVRSAHEASLAIEAGVDLIDIKEPSAGALGAASPEVIDEIVRLVNRRSSTSVACGELIQSAADIAKRLPGSGATPTGIWPDYVKVGLSGCGSIDDWPQKWRQFLALLPPRSAPVAVIYADWREADAPPPAEVIEQARSVKRSAVLVDTFDKSGPGLLRLSSIEVVRALIDEVRGVGMSIAIAGQLTFDDAVAVALLGPDYVGVRGGVCRPDRNGDLDRERLMKWRSMVAYPDEARRLAKQL
ncbi:MAG: (5-formylfuran-3-yl)methyl phosphate synthase [Pirellulales bacterium]